MPSISMGDRPLVGETTILMPYCIVSEEGRRFEYGSWLTFDMSWQTPTTSRIAERFNVKGPFIFDLNSWHEEPYPNKVGSALDDDGKDSREKNEEILWAYGVVAEKQLLSRWFGWRLRSLLYQPMVSTGESISFRSPQSAWTSASRLSTFRKRNFPEYSEKGNPYAMPFLSVWVFMFIPGFVWNGDHKVTTINKTWLVWNAPWFASSRRNQGVRRTAGLCPSPTIRW